jgi:hypothetical protein
MTSHRARTEGLSHRLAAAARGEWSRVGVRLTVATERQGQCRVANDEPPNTRMQRTRSSPSALRSPLMRYPLGGRVTLAGMPIPVRAMGAGISRYARSWET